MRRRSYDGNVAHGYDVAALTFSSEFDPSIPRYQIVSAGFDTTADALLTGFGQTGIGTTGATLGGGTKRVGLNTFEAQGLGAAPFNVGGITNNSTQLTADFDSGIAANDAFDFWFGPMVDLGKGGDEVGFGSGDSGGPAFFDVDPSAGVDYRIGGVNSYIFSNCSGRSSTKNPGFLLD